MKKAELLEKLDGIICRHKPEQLILIAIDGVDTSGKTTLANILSNYISDRPVVRLSIDGFHNPKEIRIRQGEYSPEGYYEDSFDYSFLTTRIFDRIRKGAREVVSRIYNYRREEETRQEIIEIPFNAAIIFDGVFLLREELADYWDISIFLDISFETVLNRAAVRDLEYFGDINLLKEKYQKRYIPGQKIYFEREQPKEKADLVIDYNDYDNPEWIKRRGSLFSWL